MSPYSKTLLACLLLLPYTAAASYGLCKGAKTDVKEDTKLSDYGSMVNGLAVSWERRTAEGVVHDVETPAACFDLAYYNASLPRKASVEYDQETQICSIYRGSPLLGLDYPGTAKASVFIGINHLCDDNDNFASIAEVQKLLNGTDSKFGPSTEAALHLDDPATKAAYSKAGCCDIWFPAKKKA
ncbi:hypothetical protein FFLO_05486 [Filobasidium floriforme]|uniref:Uncharacterized protein n=1 Tax=Filobasidium floriforme TaxID=5210 RepID=A0A8K0JGU4_9TREE|nr:hypothetical protein FFLO_05486 [Filobasidium floriforme]